MPIFDYRCDACGYTFDVLQKLGAELLTECPDCGQAQLKKLLSAPAFHLKGKGWRKSDDTPKKPHIAPKFGHTFDSATPHAEHTHDEPARKAKQGSSGGHAHGKNHGHSHGDHSNGDHGHSHGVHSHATGAGHSHDHGSHSHGSEKSPAKASADKKGDHGHSHDSTPKPHSHGHSHKHD